MKKVVAFCPWIQFRTAPFTIAGVQATSLRQVKSSLAGEDAEAANRAILPYYDHFLSGGRLRNWNDNPLLYIIDAANPLREPSHEEAHHINLVNSFLFLCTFALNEVGPGGLQFYTNASDWVLYFQPVQDPQFFAIGERRLYGKVSSGGHQWKGSAFTLPVECNRFELCKHDNSLIDGVTNLDKVGHAKGYLEPLRTFMIGTSDNSRWDRERDLPFIWGAIEQIIECDPFKSCQAAKDAVSHASQTISLEPNHSLSFVRAVLGTAPKDEYVWSHDFRRGRKDEVNKARLSGIKFSALERALDELNWARNRIVHDGFVSSTEWGITPLAFLGSRFFIIAFKKILAWENVRKWTDEDDCEVLGLQAFAKEGQTSLTTGYDALKRTVTDCCFHRSIEETLKNLNLDEN